MASRPPSFTAYNQTFSCLGGRVMPIFVDLSGNASVDLDLTNVIDASIIDFISSVYLFNTSNQLVTLAINNVPQICRWEPNSIGYFPLMLDNQSPRLNISAPAVIPGRLNFIFSNIPFFPFYQRI